MIKKNVSIIVANTPIQKDTISTYRYPLKREIPLQRHQTPQRHIDRITLLNLTHIRGKA